MKRIGLLGGMSWESTALYYRFLNEGVKERLGGLHSAELLLHSVDFAGIEASMRAGRWAEAGGVLAAAAAGLERGGAACIVLCTNTLHKVAPAIEAAVSIPLLHIADPTATAVRAAGFSTVGLLATGFTMEEEFYVGRLRERHRLDVLTPDAVDRKLVHRVIFDELCLGTVRESSRREYERVIADFAARGAQAVIFGCTEITMLIDPAECALPAFDTTRLHALAALDFALA